MKDNKSILETLNGMALKIVMIEPGDLSMVGELLNLLDGMLRNEAAAESSLVIKMGGILKSVLEKIVMAELSDSAANYEILGECITIMQETARSGDKTAGDNLKRFSDRITTTGYILDGMLLADSKSGGEAQAASNDERFEFLKDGEMLNSFIEESFEHLESIEVSIIEIENQPDDPEVINRIFRAFHTMKGIANCLNLVSISSLAHESESLLDEVRSGRRPMSLEIIEVVLTVRDMMRDMVHNIKEVQEEGKEHYKEFDLSEIIDRLHCLKGKEGGAAPPLKKTDEKVAGDVGKGEAAEVQPVVIVEEISEVPAKEEAAPDASPPSPPDFLQDKELLSGFIEESAEHLETIEVNVLELENSPDDLDIINNIFRPFHTIKGVSGFLNLKTINKLAHTTENLLDDVRNGVRPMDSEIIDVVLSVGDCLKSMIKNIKEVLEEGPGKYKETDIRGFIARINKIQSSAVGAGTLEPSDEEIGDGQEADEPQEAAEVVSAGSEISRPVATAAMPARPAAALAAAAAIPAVQQAAAGKIGASIKVGVEKLDALVNAVGELVIMQSLVQENPLISRLSDPKLTKDFSQLTRITSELQKTAMSMRMVPIRQTFQKMIRLVRDLSKKSGKDVELIMEGEETEIDRNMVDSIYDPLVHMIRNSVDHGVQLPTEREKNGKPGTGTVYLRAYQKGGNMVIEIEDDGEGLNTVKIKRKALERNLISEDDNLSDHELNNLIFLPGFSTADKITDVSGRGVGMDVVKKAVDKLRGKVDVNSVPGRGSQFVIRLPLTLAIIDGIIVRVGSERYIIPTIAIRESLKPEKQNYKTVYGKGEAILIRDHLIPIVRLYQVFGVEPSIADPCEAILVVVENEGRQRALMVDELLGKQEVVIKNLGGLTDIEGVAGGTILGDGRVGLILDLAGLVGQDGQKSFASATEDETAPA